MRVRTKRRTPKPPAMRRSLFPLILEVFLSTFSRVLSDKIGRRNCIEASNPKKIYSSDLRMARKIVIDFFWKHCTAAKRFDNRMTFVGGAAGVTQPAGSCKPIMLCPLTIPARLVPVFA